jgi:isochorismate synthase
MPKIFEKAAQYFYQKLPFVLYCKPNSDDVIGFFQQNGQLHYAINFAEKGFVFSSFDGNQVVIFPENECEILVEKHTFDTTKIQQEISEFTEVGKINFEALVNKGLQFINAGVFQKVVLSRKETVAQEDFAFLAVFQKMRSEYQNTFRYCLFHPEIGMWLGATPEQLLNVKESKFRTVALAGTQKYNATSGAVWEGKELQEQQFVTEFIVSELNKEVEKIAITEPYTFQAGNVVHLKTDIEGFFKPDFDLKKVLQILHPTPAVCGFPKEIAKQFILENEGYNRKFYAGFLGELNRNVLTNERDNSDLYVNLRCMEVVHNHVHLYVGCGITKESNPEKEYIETANKALTMKHILK